MNMTCTAITFDQAAEDGDTDVAEHYRAQIALVKAELDALDYKVTYPWRAIPHRRGADIPVRIQNMAGLYPAVLLLWKYDHALASKVVVWAHGDARAAYIRLVWCVAGMMGVPAGCVVRLDGWDEKEIEQERRVLTRQWVWGLGMLLRFVSSPKDDLF